MKKYKINWFIMIRNLMFTMLLMVCILATMQINYYNGRIDQMNEELEWINNL